MDIARGSRIKLPTSLGELPEGTPSEKVMQYTP